MNDMMGEKDILNNLGLENFNDITEDKLGPLVPMLAKADSETTRKALEAIEAFPQFSEIANGVVNTYKTTLDRAAAENKESIQSYYETCNGIIATLKEELKKEKLSFDEKKYVIDKMVEVSDRISAKDSENKSFLTGLANIAGMVAVAAVSAVAGAAVNILLGGKQEPEPDKPTIGDVFRNTWDEMKNK